MNKIITVNKQEVNAANGDSSFKNFGFKGEKKVRRLDQGSWRVEDFLPSLPRLERHLKTEWDWESMGWAPKQARRSTLRRREGWGSEGPCGCSGGSWSEESDIEDSVGSAVGRRTPPPSHNR